MKVKAWAKMLPAEDGLILSIPEYGLTIIGKSYDDAIHRMTEKLGVEARIRINSGEKLPPPILSTTNEVVGGVWLEAEV